MSRLLVATRSRGKQPEFRELLAPLGREIVFPDELGLAESAAEDRLEVHDSFEANASAKAGYFMRLSGLDTLADDSGLEVDALDGEPGVQSKRFAGRSGADHEVTAANNAELLRRLAAVQACSRTARYRCVLVYRPADQAAEEIVVEGVTTGRILGHPEGEGGFGYDPLFLSDDLGISLGLASRSDKARISHRGRAVAALIERLTC